MDHRFRSPAGRLSVGLATLLCLPASWVVGSSCLCGTVADDLVAARAGLQREWIVQVPFDSGRWRLDRVVVGRDLVVAEAGDGTLAAISTGAAATPGTVLWSRPGDGSRFPIESVGIGSDSVAAVRGNSLTTIDAATGRTIWSRPLPASASAAAVPAGGSIYAPTGSSTIAKLPERPATMTVAEAVAEARAAPDAGSDPAAADRYEMLSSPGGIDLAPLPYENGILWCTSGGRLVAEVTEDDRTTRLEFDLGGPPSGPPVVRGGDVFVATTAGDVARIARSPSGLRATTGVGRDSNGDPVPYTGWHTVVDGQPEGGPIVGDGTVVVSLGPSGLAAFDAETGQLRWKSSCAGKPLVIIDGRVWCIDAAGFLSARDLQTGRRVARMRLGCLTVPVVDPRGERLVLASPEGLVVSLAGRRTVPAKPPVPAPGPLTSEEGPSAAAD